MLRETCSPPSGKRTTTRCGASQCFLDCGDDFLALFRGSSPGLDHFAFALEGFRPDDVVVPQERSVGGRPAVPRR